MGRRRGRRAKPSRARPKLDTTFDCPFCSNKDVVEVKMDRPALIGNLKCRICGVTYQMRAKYLDEPVDVYCEWIDEATEKKDMLERERREQQEKAKQQQDEDDDGVGEGIKSQRRYAEDSD
eukprot:GEMP01086833.1.p1 GENE.GEMP01086833.1~~GEMP01086833.1.p1  ORF type:complete len:134 (+),score=26.73 GEMP01086833.1:40-402(+)